jgi:threonine dehydrogenase-like Zn-dependent dehydrogenase
MRGIIVTAKHQLELVDDIPVPRLGEYEALVKNECCIICNGTDNEILNGKLAEVTEYPAMLGHESAGFVVETGAKVRNYHIGDLVVRSNLKKNEKYASGWGAFSEYGLVVDYFAMEADNYPGRDKFTVGMMQRVYPKGINPVQAAMMITVKEVWSTLTRIGVTAGDRLLIVGDGPVALCMISFGRAKNIKEMLLLGQNHFTMPVARELGAIVYDDNNPAEKESLLTNYKGKITQYIDTVGLPSTIQQGLPLLAPEGMITVYGLRSGDELRLPVKGMRNFGVRFMQWPIHRKEGAVHDEVCRAVLEKRLDPDKLISHILPIEDYQKGFDLIRDKKAIKVALVFNRNLLLREGK